MKKRSLLFAITFFFAINTFSQNKLPDQLLGNWLSPKTNEWKFGFTHSYVVADGSFWTYKIKSQKKTSLVLVLENEKAKEELYITLGDDNTAKIGYSKKNQVLYTTNYNEQPDYAFYETAGFKLPILKTGTFHLKGVLNGYDKNLDKYQYFNLVFRSLIQEDMKSFAVKLDSLGRFDIEFPMMNPQEVKLVFGNELVEFYAAPGDSVMASICINRINRLSSMQDFMIYITSRPGSLFMGQASLLNTEINDFSYRLRLILNFKIDSDNQKEMVQQEYKVFRLNKMNELLSRTAEYAHQHRSSKKFTQYFERFIKFSTADDLLRYSWINTKKRMTLTRDYLSFINNLQHDNELNITTEYYGEFLSEVSMLANNQSSSIKPPTVEEATACAENAGNKFTLQEESLIRKNIVFTLNGLDTLKLIQSGENQINDERILRALLAGALKSIDIQKEMNKMQLIREFGIRDGSLSNDILTAKAADMKITFANGIMESELSQLEKDIKCHEIFDVLAFHDKELKAKIAGGLPVRAHVIDASKDDQVKLLETLLSKYRGKVVYIDFWAPWCGPCMGEMPQSKNLRKELDGKNVVFLYLGVNCSEESWAKTIKTSEIEGEHYLLSNDEYALLRSRFQISGIPRYMLINKKGEIIDDNAKRPSETIALTQEINQLLQ